MNDRSRHRFDLLDAFRGVAILAVMLLHACERGMAADNPLWHAHIWPVVSHGYLGVQLFFVISGYCITAAVHGMYGWPRPLKTFLTRRLRRIFPPYWWSMLLVVALGVMTVTLLGKTWTSVFPLTPTDWLLNAALLQGPFGAPDANSVYWSLSIELQFYFVMAGCLFGRRWAEPYLIGVSLVCAGLQSFGGLSLSGTVLNYWQEFACGIAVFYLLSGEHRLRATPWALLAIVVGTAAATSRMYADWMDPDGRLIFPLKLAFCLMCAGLMLALHRVDERLSRSRWMRPLTMVGVISYSLYLTHVPLGTRVFNLGERLTGLEGAWWMVSGAGAIAIAFAGGTMFYMACERPWLNSKRAAVPRSVAVPAAPQPAEAARA